MTELSEQITVKQLAYLRELCGRHGLDADTEARTLAGCVAVDLTRRQATDVIHQIEKEFSQTYDS